jgi:RNA polymerase sigma factor (sigma-70 family)
MNRVLRHLRRAALLFADEGLSDAQLLEAFLARREGAAFEALLRRHGPMVLGVCRRVLRNAHDAEDAFQATFLVLARKAGSVRSREVLASWLYGVAYRTSMKARAMNAKRRTKEREASASARPAALADGRLEELLERLDEELHRLPDKYRAPVVLCELEGRSRREAALQLGLVEGTLSWRLAQARKLLARKLSRYGAVLSAGAVTAALSQGATSARLSPSLLASTARHVVTAGPVPAKVMALTEGVMKAMFLSKLKVVGWAVVLAASVGAGVVGLTYRASAQQVSPPDEFVAQKAPLGAQTKVRAAPDDLESLRLEIEALRKELRATRERVKALEARVQGPGGGYSKPAPVVADGTTNYKLLPKGPDGKTYHKPVPKVSDDDLRPKPKGPNKATWAPPAKGPKTATDPSSKAGGWRFGGQPLTPKADADPMAEFEEAVKRLRKDPKDKEATAALEMALRRLRQGDFKRKPSSK